MKLNLSTAGNKIKKFLKSKTGIVVKHIDTPPVSEEQSDWDKKLVFSLAKKRFPTWQQLQYVPLYLSKKEKIIIRMLLGLVGVSLIFLLVGFYQRHIVYLPKSGGSYSEGLVGQPTLINPILSQSDVDRDLTRLIYSGLFKYNEQLELVPDLAEGYAISEDKLTYTITLKKDVNWHNGNSFLADDVLFTYEAITDPEYNSTLYGSFRGIIISRVDDFTITFVLPEPFAPFLSNLTTGILPGHIWSDIAPGNFPLAEYNTKPIGTGPFIFKELSKDRTGTIKTYTLVKNEFYHDQPAYLDKIIFKFYGDFESAITALSSGSVDGISYIPKKYRATIEKNKDINIHSLQLPQYTALFLNQKNDIFKNEDINKALSLATDKEKILKEALNGQGKIVGAPILEGFLGYHPDIATFDYNPTRAAEVLDEQGWKIPDEGGLRQKDGAELRFALTTVDQAEYLKTADILKENWEAVNIGIELKIMNPNRVDREVIKPRNYETFLYGEILGSDPDPYPFWHSSQSVNGGLNLSNYFNKEADKLLEEARQLENPDERAQKYIEFQNILIDDMPAIFLYSPSYDYGVTKNIQGIDATRITVPSDRFSGIETWYTKTKLSWE